MNLDYVRQFIVVAQCQSLKKASARLHLSQSALSKHMASLEGQLGFTLFCRTSNTIRLTDEGRRFLSGSSELLSKFDSLLDQCRSSQQRKKRRIRVMEMTFESSAFMHLCTQCSAYQEAENVDITYVGVSEAGPIADLITEVYDVALVFRFNEMKDSFEKQCSDQGIRCMPFFQDSAVVWFRSGSDLASKIDAEAATFSSFSSTPIRTTAGRVYDFMKDNLVLAFAQQGLSPLFRLESFGSVADYFLSRFDNEVLFTLTGALERTAIASRQDVGFVELRNDCFKMTAYLATKAGNPEGNVFLDHLQKAVE